MPATVGGVCATLDCVHALLAGVRSFGINLPRGRSEACEEGP